MTTACFQQLDCIPVSVFAVSKLNLKLLFVNRKGLDTYGLRMDSVSQRTLPDFHPLVERGPLLKVLSAKSEPDLNQCTWHHIYADGTVCEVQMHCAKYTHESSETFIITVTGKNQNSLREQELCKQVEHLTEAKRMASLGRWDYDHKQKKLFWSGTIYPILGMQQNDVQPDIELFLKMVHQEDVRLVYHAWLNSLKNNQISQIEHRIVTQDGQIRWVNEVYRTTHDADGNPVHTMGIVQDITGRKDLENEVSNISSLQKILLSIANNFINIPASRIDAKIQQTLGEVGSFIHTDRVYIFEYDFKNEVCNNTYEWCAAGVSSERKNLQKIPLRSIPEWLNAHLRNEPVIIEDVLQLPETCSVRAILEQQQIRSLVSLPMFSQNQPIGFIGFDSVGIPRKYPSREVELLNFLAAIIVNALNRKKFDQELVESEEKFRQLSDNVPEIFWLKDLRTSTVIYKNPAYRLFCDEDENTENHHLSSLVNRIYEEDKAKFLTYFYDQDQHTSAQMEIRLYDSSDNLRWFILNIQPVYNADRKATRQVGIMHEVTRLKQAEKLLNEALKMEKKLNELKTSLVSIVSHDVRSPLSTLVMAAEGISHYRYDQKDTGIQRNIDIILRKTREIMDLITRVLNMSEIESGNIKLSPAKTDVAHLIKTWLNENQHHYFSDHAFAIHLGNDPVYLNIDPTLFTTTLGNLISNSVKYSPANTLISIKLIRKRGIITISVADHGPGIPENEMHKLFDRRYRTYSAGQHDGYGIGLHSVKLMVEMLDGKVRVKSKVNKGSVFFIEFPETASA